MLVYSNYLILDDNDSNNFVLVDNHFIDNNNKNGYQNSYNNEIKRIDIRWFWGYVSHYIFVIKLRANS